MSLVITHQFKNIFQRPPFNLSNYVVRHLFVSTQKQKAQVDVSPKNALLDNPPLIKVQGLKSEQKVTLWNVYTDDGGLGFSSHAHYVADKDGTVDVQYHSSHGGKYEGVFTEGLVSSLHASPPTYKEKPQLKWARLYKQNVADPMKYSLKVIDGHVSEEELFSNNQLKSLCGTEFYRHLMADGVRRVEIDDKNLQGVIFLPQGEGPFPAVLDLFGVESGIKEYRSAMLASYGYASLVLPYYNYKNLPLLKDRINLDYFLNAIEFLNNYPEISHTGIGIVGSSKGGEIGLTLSSLTDKIKACITINAYHRTIDIDYYLNNSLFLEKMVGSPENANVYVNSEGKFIAFGADDFYHWDTHHILPIEKIKADCQVLIVAGDGDGGHSHRSAISLKERARRFNKANTSIVIYPQTGHLIDPPFHSHIDAVWNSTILIRNKDGERHKGYPHYYGGTPYHSCQSAKDLWKRMLALFHKRLVQNAGLPIHKVKLYPPY